MSDGATLYHEDLLEQERQLEGLLASNNGQLSADQITKAQATLKRLNKMLQQFRIEVRLLDDDTQQKRCEGLAQTHSQTIAGLKASLQKAQQQQQAAAAAVSSTTSPATRTAVPPRDASSMPPLAPVASTSGGNGGATKPSYSLWSPQEGDGGADGVDDGKGDARQAATRIRNTQQSTLQSLGNTERLLGETETMGNEAATTLQKQTEQIQQTNQELDEMHSEVGRARKELKSFMRRMARDRIIIFFSVAIVVCLIIIVVLAIIKHKLK